MYSFAALSLAVLGNLFVVESVPEKSCRCEAPFESLYDRRHRPLLEGLDRGLKLSLQDGFPYDYGTAYTIDVGYFVIDGVIVLPDSSEICQTLDHGNAGVMAWMEPLGRRRNLAVDSNQQSSRALRGKLQIAQHAKMRGMKGVMSNAVGNDQRDSSQRYFTHKGRKTDGKGVGMRKATAQVIDILTSSLHS